MSQQMIIPPGKATRLYNPSRDLAYLYVPLLRTVADSLEDNTWAPALEVLKQHEVTMDELGEACKKYIEFFQLAASGEGSPDCVDALEKCGWFELRPVVHLAFCAVVGRLITGMTYSGIRDLNFEGFEGLASPEMLTSVGERVARHMARPAWQRWVIRFAKSCMFWR